MAAAQVEPDSHSIKHRATMPTSPEHKRRSGNFFQRHLGRRRRSSVTLANGHPISASPQAQASKSAPRKGSVASSSHSMEKAAPVPETANGVPNGTVNVTEASEEEETTEPFPPSASQSPPASPGSGPKAGGVKWATGFTEDLPTRTRRASSAGTASTRRTSIYVRGVDGRHVEGVDAGVGSKARKLSVHIPEQMQTDECPLADHFSMFARANKKDIGEGGAALVRLMQSKTAGPGKDKVFAVKEFRERDAEEEDERDYVRKIKSEYAISKSCDHPNIVETYRLCFADSGKKWFHVMQYCELGDLTDLIKLNYLSREDRNCMFKQLMRGVEYLHKCGIAHRDLKADNLLLTKDGCLKIADFGTAEVFCGTHPGLRGCRRPSIIDEDAPIRKCSPGLVGSRPYMAPEIIEHEDDYDPRAVDIWSCAIVYLTLALGATPWESATRDVKNYNIYCNTWDEWRDRFPDGIIKEGRPLPGFVVTKQFQQLDDEGTKLMVMGMLHPDPSKRWSAKDALESKTVKEYPCCQQAGYSDDIKTRQRKAMHNHVPPQKAGKKFLKPGVHK